MINRDELIEKLKAMPDLLVKVLNKSSEPKLMVSGYAAGSK